MLATVPPPPRPLLRRLFPQETLLLGEHATIGRNEGELPGHGIGVRAAGPTCARETELKNTFSGRGLTDAEAYFAHLGRIRPDELHEETCATERRGVFHPREKIIAATLLRVR